MVRRTTAVFGASLAVAIGAGILTASGSAARAGVPKNESPPVIRGASQEGSVLQAEHGRWRSSTGIDYSYQWRRCLADGTGCIDIPKATDQIYSLRGDDLAHTLRVAVTARNKDGAAAATSAATVAVTALPAQAPHNTVLPTVLPAISGSAAPGQILTATPGTWTGATPIAFSYRWRRCDAVGGDCADTSVRTQTYKLASGDAGHTLRVLVTATNAAGTSNSLADPSPLVARPSKPVSASPPTISGTAQQGKTLAGSRGTWTNSPTGFDYGWQRCNQKGKDCDGIGGARGTTYSLASADVGHRIRFKVTARNAGGSTTVFSAATAVVAAAPAPKVSPPANTSPPTISGTAQEGKTLTGSPGTWTNGPTSYDYSWRRCNTKGDDCDGISGVHSTTYTLKEADVGHTIRFRVKATNAGGSTTATSAPTAVVRAAAKPDNTAPPTISGTPQEGKPLAGNRGSWTHSPADFGYAWLRCDRNGGSCAAIGGAHGTGYTLTSADVGNTVRFQVTASNSEGSTTATSVPSAVIQKAVAPPPPRPSGCPAGGNPDQVGSITPPARLIVDALQSDPRVVTRSTFTLVVRFHVTSTCGGPVQGALVYATATPYNQFSIPPEATTGADGWATLVFQRLRGFPVSRRQQLIAMFVRARKPGESLLGGISTRRLVSIPVALR